MDIASQMDEIVTRAQAQKGARQSANGVISGHAVGCWLIHRHRRSTTGGALKPQIKWYLDGRETEKSELIGALSH